MATSSSSILLIVFTVLASTWTVQGMSDVVYSRDGSVYCQECPSGTTTYTERRIITRPSQTFSAPYYNIQSRVVNNPSNDNTLTQQTYYTTYTNDGTYTVDSNLLIF